MSALDTLRAATPATTTVTMCVDGALQAEWEALLEERDEATQSADQKGSLALPALTDLADRLDAVRDRVLASEVTFRFERMGPWQEIALRAEHAPREDSALDKALGFNAETYYPALIKATCVSVAKGDEEPEAIPDEVWDVLLGTNGSLNAKQVQRLIGAANKVNNGEVAVPPSARSLLESQDFGASLALPSPGMSPQSGSEDGNPPGSPKSSTKKKASTPAGSGAT